MEKDIEKAIRYEPTLAKDFRGHGIRVVEAPAEPLAHPLVNFLTSGEAVDEGMTRTLTEIFADMTEEEIREVMKLCEARLRNERRIGFARRPTSPVPDDKDSLDLVRRGMQSRQLPTLRCNLLRRRVG